MHPWSELVTLSNKNAPGLAIWWTWICFVGDVLYFLTVVHRPYTTIWVRIFFGFFPFRIVGLSPIQVKGVGCFYDYDMGVSNNRGTPKSSILIGFSIINHPVWCTPIFGNIHIIMKPIHWLGPAVQPWFHSRKILILLIWTLTRAKSIVNRCLGRTQHMGLVENKPWICASSQISFEPNRISFVSIWRLVMFFVTHCSWWVWILCSCWSPYLDIEPKNDKNPGGDCYCKGGQLKIRDISWWQLKCFLCSPESVREWSNLTWICFRWVGEKPPTIVISSTRTKKCQHWILARVFSSFDHDAGQIIATSAEVTLSAGLVGESPQNPLNSGLGIILICPMPLTFAPFHPWICF